MTFSGFPSRGRFTPLPNVFFSEVLPRVDDINALKVILHVFWLLYPRKGRLRYVTVSELLSDKTLMKGMEGEGSPQDLLQRALQMATDMGVLVHVGFDQAEVYFLNQEADAEVIKGVRSGEIPLGDMTVRAEPHVKQERPDIFGLYEQNIGILTPMIAEDLAEAENLYPREWIEEAFREAVSQNKRSWRYVSRILERWATEGKGVGESGRHSKKDTSPDKYFRGRYGHLVQR